MQILVSENEMRILLVEDDEMIGEAVADGLKGEGYAVDWVKTETLRSLPWIPLRFL